MSKNINNIFWYKESVKFVGGGYSIITGYANRGGTEIRTSHGGSKCFTIGAKLYGYTGFHDMPIVPSHARHLSISSFI